jgi:hypothetical protein
MLVEKDLLCSFQIIKPLIKKRWLFYFFTW